MSTVSRVLGAPSLGSPGAERAAVPVAVSGSGSTGRGVGPGAIGEGIAAGGASVGTCWDAETLVGAGLARAAVVGSAATGSGIAGRPMVVELLAAASDCDGPASPGTVGVAASATVGSSCPPPGPQSTITSSAATAIPAMATAPASAQ
jgi:hypothetical protein